MDTTSYHSGLTVLGLPAERGRWLLIPLGTSVLLCLGSVYAWSVFRTPLEAELNIGATASLLPYTIALVCYAASMPIAGFCIPRVGTRTMTAIGGVVVGLGYILASFATNIWLITCAYGVIAGTGVGIAYGVPVVVAARWFPDKKGLAVGLTIIGFGLSPLITAPLENYLVETYTVRPTLRIMGFAFMLIVLAIAITLKLPPRIGNPASIWQLQRLLSPKLSPKFAQKPIILRTVVLLCNWHADRLERDWDFQPRW